MSKLVDLLEDAQTKVQSVPAPKQEVGTRPTNTTVRGTTVSGWCLTKRHGNDCYSRTCTCTCHDEQDS